MICQHCFGNGYCIRYFAGDHGEFPTWIPCPQCGGSGHDYCCSGDQTSERDKETDQEAER